MDHFRLQNEREVLLHFQNKTQHIRPLLDEIGTAPSPSSLILRYLDDEVLQASNSRHLSRFEVKYVAKAALTALAVLHEEGFVHTGTLPFQLK